MSTGVSRVYYLEGQPKPLCELQVENSYFLVRLHDAQAFFKAGWLEEVSYLILSSSVESSFQPGSPTQSLYQIATLKKNTPCHLGVTTNLTDWLPARTADTLKISLKYTVVKDTPFKDVVDKMGQLKLAAKVSVVLPELAVAMKVSEIAGQFLSFALQEGSQHEIFPLTLDLNLATLKSGYYGVIGSYNDQDWPSAVRLDAEQRLTDRDGRVLKQYSYAIFEVVALPRIGEETAREEAWWELLQAGKEQVSDAFLTNDQDRRKAMENWQATLTQVRALTRKARGYLLQEINEMIRMAQKEVEQKLLPQTKPEALNLETLSDAWQEVLGVGTAQELQESVRSYQDALTVSRQLIQTYKL